MIVCCAEQKYYWQASICSPEKTDTTVVKHLRQDSTLQLTYSIGQRWKRM